MKPFEAHIPDKLYFRIGEVSDIVGVKPYVLRYWESEFQDISPTKSKSGQRLYKRRDVETLMWIKQLLYDERYTINGARKRLKEVLRGDAVQDPPGTSAAPQARAKPEIPRQLDVFATANDDTPAPRGGGPENRKLLLKLREDLESLLQELTV